MTNPDYYSAPYYYENLKVLGKLLAQVQTIPYMLSKTEGFGRQIIITVEWIEMNVAADKKNICP